MLRRCVPAPDSRPTLSTPPARRTSLALALSCALTPAVHALARGEDRASHETVVLRDEFRGELAEGWSWLREAPDAWAVHDRELWIRAQPGNMWGGANDARNVLVRTAPDAAGKELAIEVTVEDEPTEQWEQAGVMWFRDESNMVKLVKERVDGEAWIVMGREEGDRCRTIAKVPLETPSVQLRLRLRGDEALGDFRPGGQGAWRRAGTCTLPPGKTLRISLQTYNGPADATHWARFSSFRVLRLEDRTAAAGTTGEEEAPLIAIREALDRKLVTATDASVTVTAAGALLVRTGHEHSWPGITIRAPGNDWNLGSRAAVRARVFNPGPQPIVLHCRVDNPGADGRQHCVSGNVRLGPGQEDALRVRLSATPWRPSRPLHLVGMRAAPGDPDTFDAGAVTRVLFFIPRPREDHAFEIRQLVAEGNVTTIDADAFLPFIDEFGQFRHADWPGKTHSVNELRRQRQSEARELESRAGPPDRDRFGGWMSGPGLAGTGFFRAQKHEGRWWLVDPEGRLFWSHGVDCVRPPISTPITDREDYFAALPPENSPLAEFYGSGSWAPHGYYSDHAPYRTYDFGRANLLRKYGDDWPDRFADITHLRLRSWGLNTIANWSDPAIFGHRRTPYVATINFRSRPLEGSEGYWGKFFDVFDPGFREALARRMQGERGRSAGDPWCIGYFVHNELSWGDELSLAVAAISSPADQPAKQVFADDLRQNYGTIRALNEAWGTRHDSWDAFLRSQEPPDRQRARSDLAAFYSRIAETYFRTVREEVKRVAPDQLYMGCRFAWVNDRAARAAIRHCDVVSYNRYAYGVEDLRLPDGADRPVIIGEFHFGALDRGMFHTGLRPTESQEARADAYRSYVRGALRNPLIVGTHWFQYRDQATTGRGDGENYQIGLTDVCDTPYPETIHALRDVGYSLYRTRMEAP